jgi:predicted secreted protein
MQRSGNIILLSHCLLNPNSKTRGSARPWSEGLPLLQYLLSRDVGIYQLPCPEQTFSGSKRWGQSKEQYSNPYFRKHCRSIIDSLVLELSDYKNSGYHLLGLLGIKGSPSCGVRHTFTAAWGGERSGPLADGENAAGTGVFIEELSFAFSEAGLAIPLLEIDEEDINSSLLVLQGLSGL